MTQRDAWADWTTLALGLWLATSPWSLGYAGTWLGWSDLASGLLMAAVSALALRGARRWRWAAGLVALWVLNAPVFLPGATAAAFATDTLLGLMAFSAALLVPGSPEPRAGVAPEGGDVPRGWSYNPSTWDQRLVPVVFAFLALLVARGLWAYQLGLIPHAWDPFFGDQTVAVLDSEVSRAFPVPDAGLGAVGYALDALAGLLGGTRRWATMPWIVLLFGIFIVPFGIVSITLVILQPVAVGAWCTGCLFTALMSLLMIPFAVDEVGASLQFLARARREGQPFRRTLWDGGDLAREPMARPEEGAGASGGGVTYPWPLVASALLGALLMALPALTGASGAAATSAHLAGPLAVTVAVVALAEPARAARFANAPLGAWVAAAPWLLGGGGAIFAGASVVLGAALVALSVPRGRVESRYGALQRYIV